MEEYIPLLSHTPLFAGVVPDRLPGLLDELGARTARFDKNASILQAGEPAGGVGVVLEGAVQVVKEDFMGNRTILAKLGPGELFGEAFASAGTPHLPVSALAVERSRALLFRWSRFAALESEQAGRLHQNMMGILALKNVMLNQKIEILSRRTTRDKLIAYLSSCAQGEGSRRFTIPFNRQELADYLCVERSAMSAELSRLRREGLVEYERSRFLLKTEGGEG